MVTNSLGTLIYAAHAVGGRCLTRQCVVVRGATTITNSDNQALSAVMLWSMTDAGREVVKVP